MKSHLLIPASLLALSLFSCGDKNSSDNAVITTPANGKVNLSKVSLKIDKVEIICKNENTFTLSFDYTLINKAGATISFLSIHAGKNELIDVTLTDKNGDPLRLKKNPQDDLTLASPRPMLIPKGKFKRTYIASLWPELRETGDPITVRVRWHAPSRYDELRSTVEAPRVTTPWPKQPERTDAEQFDPTSEDNPLTFPSPEATYPTR